MLIKENFYLSNKSGIFNLIFQLSQPLLKEEGTNFYKINLKINLEDDLIVDRTLSGFGVTQTVCKGLFLLNFELEFLIKEKDYKLFSSKQNAEDGVNDFQLTDIFIK
jgi:hypothetical protein